MVLHVHVHVELDLLVHLGMLDQKVNLAVMDKLVKTVLLDKMLHHHKKANHVYVNVLLGHQGLLDLPETRALRDTRVKLEHLERLANLDLKDLKENKVLKDHPDCKVIDLIFYWSQNFIFV